MKIAATIFIIFALVTVGAGAQTSGPAAPTNLEVINVTQHSITLAWGPSQPGNFVNLGEPNPHKVLVGWGASQDSRSPVTYTFIRDGATVATGLTQPQYLLTGIALKTTFIRICVIAKNMGGQSSPMACGSLSRGSST